ncbi:Zn(II)2Cys6 transcription factor [Aspergillus ambiguus]|uniref:Zn(II)2Cys6 transcription factor n=1 Tax=Aspergillus ambiguus TaxID=176160 RepID=UPI003CCE4AC2
MDTVARGYRIKKRSSNACVRCRRQKIKCSGSQPCETCRKRQLTCVFDDRDQKILVTRGFLEDLQRKVAALERSQEAGDSQIDRNQPPQAQEDGNATENLEDPEWDTTLDAPSDLTNPLSTGPSTFMTAESGRIFYLGTSSNWSFSRKVLSLLHVHLYQSPLPTGTLLFDESAYDLGWDGSRTVVLPEVPMTPSLDYSIYLINSVKFHAGQLYHLFDEESFMEGLYAFHNNSKQETSVSQLWYIHYLLLIAFGKAFVVQIHHGSAPAGYSFFLKALQMLPDTTRLSRDPVIATEILCCIALYLQSLDFRSSAYGFIGQAVRIALAQGMHTNMPFESLGQEVVQRCRKIWWTVYILDRQMTSLMGLPQSLQDSQMHDELPLFPSSPQKLIALNLQIKMCHIIAEVNNTVYGPDGRLNRKFLSSTKKALSSTASLGQELRQAHPLQLDESCVNGICRLSAHLHLLYHQCIVLATRPLLFCFLKMKLQDPALRVRPLTFSTISHKLLQVCVDSAQQMLSILGSLQNQSLLDSFLPFDLESTVVSTFVLLVLPAVDHCLLDESDNWLRKSCTILDEMIFRGNRIAAYRKSELDQLSSMLDEISDESSRKMDCEIRQQLPSFLTPHSDDHQEVDSHGFTTADIMAVAESIDIGDVDWIAHAVTENRIW